MFKFIYAILYNQLRFDFTKKFRIIFALEKSGNIPDFPSIATQCTTYTQQTLFGVFVAHTFFYIFTKNGLKIPKGQKIKNLPRQSVDNNYSQVWVGPDLTPKTAQNGSK